MCGSLLLSHCLSRCQRPFSIVGIQRARSTTLFCSVQNMLLRLSQHAVCTFFHLQTVISLAQQQKKYRMVSRVCDLNEAPSIIFRSIFYSSRVCFAYKINIQHCWHFSLYFILICKLWHFKWGFKKVSRKSSDNIRFFNWFIDNS